MKIFPELYNYQPQPVTLGFYLGLATSCNRNSGREGCVLCREAKKGETSMTHREHMHSLSRTGERQTGLSPDQDERGKTTGVMSQGCSPPSKERRWMRHF